MFGTTLSRGDHRVSIDSQLGWLAGGGKKRHKDESESQRLLHKLKRPSHAQRPKRECGARVRVNISGKVFDTYHTTLRCKKGSIFTLENIWNYFDTRRGEFFFERDARSFEAIFIYMQCGLIVKPEKVPYKVFIEDLQFFGFEELAFKVFTEEVEILRKPTYEPDEIIGIRDNLWHMLEYPGVTRASRILNLCSAIVVFIATALLCAETVPIFKGNKHIQHAEMCCIFWFTIETLAKFFSSPKKVQFFKSTGHILDVVSLLPFYIYIIANRGNNFKWSLLRIFRLSRAIRSLGFVKCAKMLHIITISMQSCIKETLVLISIFAITAILYSTLIYSMENDTGQFDSIPAVMWFCFVSMTTVGYGDMYPISTGGKIVCSFVVCTSILVITLPLPVLIGNFLSNYMRLKLDCSIHDFKYDPTKSTEVENEGFHPDPLISDCDSNRLSLQNCNEFSIINSPPIPLFITSGTISVIE